MSESMVADVLDVTPSAVAKVWNLMKEEGNLGLKLRIFITGGGCSGLQYGFSFEEKVNDDDTVISRSVASSDDHRGTDSSVVDFVVDSMSLQYLMGAQIDYTEDVQSAQFVIRNPNAQTTCGCGSSFSA